MKFSRRRAVSPIIASLLLIAIAVAAGIIVYVYVNSLAGNLTGGGGGQESQQIQLQSYSFNPVTTTASGFSSSGTLGSGQLVDVFLENTGSAAITVNAVYFDGTALTEWNDGTPQQYGLALQVPDNAVAVGCYALLPTSTTAEATTTAVSTTTSTTTATTITGTATSTAVVTFGAVAGTSTSCSGEASCPPSPALGVICIAPSSTWEFSAIAPQQTVQLIIGLSAGFPPATSGTSHTIKLITATGGQAVFTVVAGRSG